MLRHDLRYAVRRLRAHPLFTLVAVLSLAVGIGVNAAVFSIVNAVLLRGPAVSEPDELVSIYTSDASGAQYAMSSQPDFRDLRSATGGVFVDVAAYRLMFGRLDLGETSRLVLGELVSDGYFELLGVSPVLGRGFTAAEYAAEGAGPVVVLSHGFWQNELGGALDVLGRTIRLNRGVFTIVGVAPPEFRGMMPGLVPELYVPLSMSVALGGGDYQRRGNRSLFMTARLRDGVTVDGAAAAVAAVNERLVADHPATNEGRRMSVVAATDVALHPVVDAALKPVAALLLAVVALVLLVACVNLAGFLLARGAERRREVAVRLALGASRPQLVRQLLLESLVLALLGGAAGVVLGGWVVSLVTALQPPLPIPISLDLAPDATVLGYTFLLSLFAAVAFGLLPALQATSPALAPTLRTEAGSTTADRRSGRLRAVLVGIQVAFSALLLIGAGLFLRSLANAGSIDPGFYTGSAAILNPSLELSGTPKEAHWAFYQRLVPELSALPGVDGVALATRIPLGADIRTTGVLPEGVEPAAGRDVIDVDVAAVDSAYFPVLEVPIVAGRGFRATDAEGAPPVAVVSEAAARRYWPGASAVGKRIQRGDVPLTVVGVARDTKVRTLGEAARPYLYVAAAQAPEEDFGVVIRGDAVPAGHLLRDARRRALELDDDLVFWDQKTMAQHLSVMLFPARMGALLLGVLGGIALALAAIGVYGAVSFAVACRTRELGIRMALGADGPRLVRWVAGGSVRTVAIGGAVGLLLALAATRLLASFLYGVSPTDLVTFTAIPALLAVVGVAAAVIPALRVSRTDPVEALRSE